jgi:tRNA G37 N-methylase Trm5
MTKGILVAILVLICICHRPRLGFIMQLLKEILPDGMTVPTAYESVGHIAHLNLREEHLAFRHIIAQVVLDKNKPRIRTVVNKTDAIHSKYRTMQLELLAGNSSLVTTVVEHGLSFRLDLASVYWNSRLSTERQRLITSFDPNDIVCKCYICTYLSTLEKELLSFLCFVLCKLCSTFSTTCS